MDNYTGIPGSDVMRSNADGQLVAVTYIQRGEQVDEAVRREIIRHRSLRHPSVVRLRELVLTPTHLAVVLDLEHAPDLYRRVRDAGRFSEDEARLLFRQLLSGVSYCHSMQVCHRDLKLEKVLLLDGSCAGSPRLKICGPGVSKMPNPELYFLPELLLLHSFAGSVIRSRERQERLTKHRCTSLLRFFCKVYIAPEIFLQREYDGKIAGVWSCGVTLYAMLVGAYPFQCPDDEPMNFRKTIQRIQSVEYSVPDDLHVSSECRDLISKIFVADPAARITVSGIRNHPWFLMNLPADDSTMSTEEMEQPIQSMDEIMRILALAEAPYLGDDMEDLVDSDHSVDITTC